MTNYTPTAEEIEAFARILAALESRRPGFSLDEAVEYRAEKWRRHMWEAERLLIEMHPWLAAHDAEVRARFMAERGESGWEYGSAIREANGRVWGHEFFSPDPITAMQLRKWNEEHQAYGADGSTVVAVRRSIPRIEVWEPAEENGGGA